MIMVDVDPAELKKTTLHVELPVCADAKDFFVQMNEQLADEDVPVFAGKEWIRKCQEWKKNYPVTQPKHWEEDGKYANVYAFIKYLSQNLPQGNMTVVSNGSACVVGSHNYVIQKEARFLINSAVASMGKVFQRQLEHVLQQEERRLSA